ncbi:MAG: C10 family peptidase [Prevotella sp.]|nr:C10 family peptidase [Prevotella sp.]
MRICNNSLVGALFVLMGLVLGHLRAFSNPVTPQMALRHAQEFMAGAQTRQLKGNRQLHLAFTLDRDPRRTGAQAPMVYVFGISGTDGFVVVAGDDAAKTILGYGTQGSADYNKMPRNMQVWLNGYADEIAWAQAHGLQAPSTRLNAGGTGKLDVPYLVPTFFDQHEPYNKDCLFGDEYCYTGCAATAMGQIMYYWAKVGFEGNTFRAGSKALSRYVTKTLQYDVPALPSLKEFDWDQIIPGRPYYNGLSWPWTAENEVAVAQLIRYCGQALQMDYTPDGSGAYTSYIPGAFFHVFGFDKNVRLVERDTMKAERWAQLIYDEVAAGRPVCLGGHDEVKNFGHEFICDGYEASTDMYHINWGWAGYCDNYFSLSALSPGGTGIGDTGADTASYTSRQDAVIGIQPPVGQIEPVEAKSTTFLASKDLGVQSRTGVESDEVTKDGVTISVWPHGSFSNVSYYYVFKESTMSVAAASGVITKVVFTCSGKDENTYGPGCFGYPSLGVFTYSGNKGTWEGYAKEFFISAMKDHVRMTKIEVTIEPEPLVTLLGDANGDGLINVSDVTAVIRYVLGAVPESFSFANADAHKDGYINMSDVTSIINIILGKPND